MVEFKSYHLGIKLGNQEASNCFTGAEVVVLREKPYILAIDTTPTRFVTVVLHYKILANRN